jgi:chemotaxis signal transduction protein
MKNELLYVGFVMRQEGMCMDSNKVKEILVSPTPKSVTKVRSFHGIDNF